MSYSFATPDDQIKPSEQSGTQPYSFAKPIEGQRQPQQTRSVASASNPSDDEQGPNTTSGGVVFSKGVSPQEAQEELAKHPEVFAPSAQKDAVLMQSIGRGTPAEHGALITRDPDSMLDPSNIYGGLRASMSLPWALAEATGRKAIGAKNSNGEPASFGDLFQNAMQNSTQGWRGMNPLTDPLILVPGGKAATTLGKIGLGAANGVARVVANAALDPDKSVGNLTPSDLAISGGLGAGLSGLGAVAKTTAAKNFIGQGPADVRMNKGANSDVISPSDRADILQGISQWGTVSPKYGWFPGQQQYLKYAEDQVAPAKSSMDKARDVATQNYASLLGTPDEVTMTPKGLSEGVRSMTELRLANAANPESGVPAPNVTFSELPSMGAMPKDVAMGYQALPAKTATAGGVPLVEVPSDRPGQTIMRYQPDQEDYANQLSSLGLGDSKSLQSRFPVNWMEGKPEMSTEGVAENMPISPEFGPSLLGAMNSRAFTAKASDAALKARDEAMMGRETWNNFMDKLGYSDALDPKAKQDYALYKALQKRVQLTPVRGQPVRLGAMGINPYIFMNEISNYSKPVEMWRTGGLMEGLGKRAFVPSSQPSEDPGK